MSYVVECADGTGTYGPFASEEEAHRYAGLLDIDPACRDRHHEVSWQADLRKPETYDELVELVRDRIQKAARSGTPLCAACGGPSPVIDGTPLRYCSRYCQPAQRETDRNPF